MKDPEADEQQQERRDQTDDTVYRAPFDISRLNQVPRARDDDPPYRSWWVVTDPDKR